MFLFQIELVKSKDVFYSGVLAKARFHENAIQDVERGGMESLQMHLRNISVRNKPKGDTLYSLVSASVYAMCMYLVSCIFW